MTASEWKLLRDTGTRISMDDVIADLAAREKELDELEIEATYWQGRHTTVSSRVKVLEEEARLNASMLAKQCDAAREAEARLAKMREACEALMEYEKAMDGADGCGENDDLYWKAVKACEAALAGKEEVGLSVLHGIGAIAEQARSSERARIREGAADRVHDAHMKWANSGVGMDGYYDMIVDAVLGRKP